MSQGSGSPVTFLDQQACDTILLALKREDGMLPNFESEPGSPPPSLEAEAACHRGTQTSSGPWTDQATEVEVVPVCTVQDNGTQVGQVTVTDQGTQALILPP